MTDKQKAEMLSQAADIVDDVAENLDLGFENCPSCGKRHFFNFGDAKMSEVLTGTSSKLRRAAGGFMVRQNTVGHLNARAS